MREYDNADDAICGCVEVILAEGRRSSPRGMGTTEVTSLAFRLMNPRARIFTRRRIRLGYAAAKVAWDLGARHDLGPLEAFNPNGVRFSDSGRIVQGENYGERWSQYLPEAIKLLRLDSDSRRAWVPIWMPNDMINEDGQKAAWNHHTGLHPSEYSTNVPCTIGFGLRIVDDALTMQAVLRSNAVVGVLPYDLFLLTTVQELIANELGVALGPYEHVMLSAHVYDRERPAVDEILAATPDREAGVMPPIEATLTEATQSYPQALGAALSNNGGVPETTDPIKKILRETNR